jgi:hypothetical protein
MPTLRDLNRDKSTTIDSSSVSQAIFFIFCRFYLAIGHLGIFGVITQGSSDRTLRPSLSESYDYMLVNKTAWDLLVKWYGLASGQEPIARTVINTRQGARVCHCIVLISQK